MPHDPNMPSLNELFFIRKENDPSELSRDIALEQAQKDPKWEELQRNAFEDFLATILATLNPTRADLLSSALHAVKNPNLNQLKMIADQFQIAYDDDQLEELALRRYCAMKNIIII